MNYPALLGSALISIALLIAPASAENHIEQPSGNGATYGSEECNNDADYLTENNILCTAIFSDTRVWDFLNNMPRRITLAELAEFNPQLGEIDHDTILTGITFVRVR